MMKVKQAAKIMMTVMLVLGLTACKSTEESGVNDSAGINEQPFSGQKLQATLYMGEITAIDGKEITVNVMGGGQFPAGMFGGGMPSGEMPSGEIPSGQMPEGFSPDQIPEGVTPDQMPEGFGRGQRPEGSESGQMPEGFTPGQVPEGFESDQMPEGFNPGEMMQGETKVIEVTKDTVITVNEKNGKISDLKTGDFIQFTMDGEIVTAISVGSFYSDR